MFEISTKGDYGLLLMTALAEKGRKKFVSLKKLAEEKRISFSYLSQIILPLKKAKLVESKEGISGGYRLAKNPSKITILEILEALEGNIAPVKCASVMMSKTGGCGCKCEKVCNVKSAWKDAVILLREFLASRTLKDIYVRNKKSKSRG